MIIGEVCSRIKDWWFSPNTPWSQGSEQTLNEACYHDHVIESHRYEKTGSPKTRGGDRLWVRTYDRVSLICADCSMSLPSIDAETDRWIATDTNEVENVDHDGRFILQLPYMAAEEKKYLDPETITPLEESHNDSSE